MSGFTLSHRDKWSNPVFRNLLEAGIWSWMCDAAAWKDTRVRFAGKLVTLKRGQLAVSERFISEGFSVGRQAVRTFLENIENDRMITREVSQSITIVTICNYDKYQVEENTTNPPDIPPNNPDPTQTQPKGNPNKNEGNKGNKGNKEEYILIENQFEDFWKLYPRKTGKKPAFKKFEIARRTTEFEIIMDGLRQYVTCQKVIEGVYVLNPETWLNQERWNDDYQQQNEVKKHDETIGNNAEIRRANTSATLPDRATGLTKRERSELATAAIISKRTAEWNLRQSPTNVTPDQGLLGLPEPS